MEETIKNYQENGVPRSRTPAINKEEKSLARTTQATIHSVKNSKATMPILDIYPGSGKLPHDVDTTRGQDVRRSSIEKVSVFKFDEGKGKSGMR